MTDYNMDPRPPLKVGDIVRVTGTGASDFTVTVEVLSDHGDHYEVRYLHNSQETYMYREDVFITWSVVERTTEPLIKVIGSRCRRCNEFNEYAEPTRESDRTHICYSCGQDGYGRTWGDK